MMHIFKKKNILHIKHCNFARLFCNIAYCSSCAWLLWMLHSCEIKLFTRLSIRPLATIKMMSHYYKLSSVSGWRRSCGGKWWKAMEKCEGGKRRRRSRKQVEKVSPAKRRRVNKLCVWHWTLSWLSLCWKSLQFQNCCLYSQTWVGQAAAGQP